MQQYTAELAPHLGQAGPWVGILIAVSYASPRVMPFLLKAWILSSAPRTERYLRILRVQQSASSARTQSQK